MSIFEHKQNGQTPLKVMVLTISDTRNEETDKSGQLMMDLLQNENHVMIAYKIVKDEKGLIEAALVEGCQDPGIDVILTNGGTGLAGRDVTIEVIQGIIEKEIPGYGELFRMLSYEEIGAASMLSRAIAGIAKGTLIFATPGSSGAVKLAMEKLILPEMTHIIREIQKNT